MITTHLHWSSDITKAPKGEMLTTTVTAMIKGKPVEQKRTEHVPTKILVLTKCGKVLPTYWLPAKFSGSGALLDGGRWSGLATSEAPVLWSLWPNAAELAAELHEARHDQVSVAVADLLSHSEEDA